MEKPDYYEEIMTQAISELMAKALEQQDATGGQAPELESKLTRLNADLTAATLDQDARSPLDRYLSVTHTLEGLRQELLVIFTS